MVKIRAILGRVASIRIRQRKDGTAYTSVLYVHHGKQSSSSFNDHAEALRFQDVCNRLGPVEALRLWEAATPQDGQTLGDFVDGHIDSLSGLERKTIAEYRRYLDRDINPVLGHIPLATVNRIDISRWVNSMRDGGSSGKTVQNKVGFLSGCLKVAVADGLIPANPVADVKLPRTIQREMCFLTRDEFSILRTGFNERWWPLLDFLVGTGCRFSEATALQPDDVDVVEKTARITKAWKKIPSSDGDGVGYELGAPKTRRSVRTIDIPPRVFEQLDLKDDWLFTNSHGGPIRLYSWRSNVWVPSLARARKKSPDAPNQPFLEKKPRIHDLRHSYASWLLGGGVHLIDVSAALGHEDMSLTAKVYGHLDRRAGRAAAAVMSEMLK